jgi:hypothetical protein
MRRKNGLGVGASSVTSMIAVAGAEVLLPSLTV